MEKLSIGDVRKAVRKRYGSIASDTIEGPGCCSTADFPVSPHHSRKMSIAAGYSEEELTAVPDGSNLGLGCGNPAAIANLKVGEVVLDLGSGGGFDCFLAARQVGENGHVIGVDMTQEMLELSRKNALKARVDNVEFRLGEIEHLPVADSMVDTVISNCVINLSPEKQKVFDEIYRVLKPGGRMAVSDIVALLPLPDDVKQDISLFSSCVAGAEEIGKLKKMLFDAGFDRVEIVKNEVGQEQIQGCVSNQNLVDYIASASIMAIKTVEEVIS